MIVEDFILKSKIIICTKNVEIGPMRNFILTMFHKHFSLSSPSPLSKDGQGKIRDWLFPCSSTIPEHPCSLLHTAIDSKKEGEGPVYNNRPFVAPFFIAFIVVRILANYFRGKTFRYPLSGHCLFYGEYFRRFRHCHISKWRWTRI